MITGNPDESLVLLGSMTESGSAGLKSRNMTSVVSDRRQSKMTPLPVKALWYEYPNLPIPHSGEFWELERVASSGTYQHKTVQDQPYCAGIVIGVFVEDLYNWTKENRVKEIERTESEERLRAVIDRLGAATATSGPKAAESLSLDLQ